MRRRWWAAAVAAALLAVAAPAASAVGGSAAATSFPEITEGRWPRDTQNANSGLVLGVSGMSTSDNAPVVQFHDNGTADHLWRLEPAS